MAKYLKIFKASFFTLALIAICLGGPIYILAADPATSMTNTFADGAGFKTSGVDLRYIVGMAIKAFLGILGMIFLFLMLYAGYSWMMAQGEEAKVTKAKDTIIRAIIGLIIIVGSYALTAFVLEKILG